MKKISVVILMLLAYSLSAQKLNIKGEVQDTLNNPLVRATVMLLDQDSVLLDYTQSGLDGYFDFKKIDSGNYIVKLTYVGYIPKHLDVQLKADNVDLGIVQLEEIATELMEVVIRAAKAPMKMFGDTLEYDISTFKVPDGSTVEDLLRRLPAMEVERDGTILSEGKVVSKVTVEGKSFFGGDPKTVTKNLPAEGVSKVQVFDNKSEEEILTGIEGTSDEKAMNLELKDDFKNGGFGKIVAAYGTEDRGELKGNYNVFNDKHQFSVVGVANNTGRNGLGWDDYQDFMGASSFNFFSQGLDYGFGRGRMMGFSFGGSQNALESKISSAFFTGSDGGYPKNASGGVNYNFDHDGKKAGARYFYNFSNNNKITERNTTTYYSDFSSDSQNESSSEDLFNGHRAELSYEMEIDSFHTFMISSDLAYVNSANDLSSLSASIRNNGKRITDSDVLNNSNFGGKMIKTTALLRKSFRKKGRFLGLNMTYVYTDVDDNFQTHSNISFYNNENELDSIRKTDRFQNSVADKNAFTGNAMFSEPISKNWFLSSFYNFSNTNQKGVAEVEDQKENTMTLNKYLSREYENTIMYQRAGTKLVYSNNGFNFTLGGAFKSVKLAADFTNKEAVPLQGKVDDVFNSWLPYVNLSFRQRRTFRIGMTLDRSVDEPSIEQLLPIVDDKNPLYITEGNPALSPKSQNRIDLNISYSIPVSGFRIYFNTSYNKIDRDIIQSQIVDQNLITYAKPVNYKGGSRINAYSGVGIPILGEKLRANVNLSANYSESFGLVNEIENETNTISYSPGFSIDFIPNDWLAVYLNGSSRKSSTKYNISTSQDQNIIQNSLGLEFNLSFGKGIGLESSYDHVFYSNDRFGEDTSVPLINASFYFQFLKEKKGTLRLSAYDMLDRNIGYSQYAGSNFISSSLTQSLSRYFMLSFTYDLRGGVKNNVQKNQIWISH